MRLRLERGPAVLLRSTATAFPSELDAAGAPGLISNTAAYELLLGPEWSEVLARRGHDADHPERAYGIASREWSVFPGRRPSVGSVELATLAARRALDAAGLAPADVDALVTATSTPARITSSFAATVAEALGADAACFDVRAGGAGSLFAWTTASALLGAGARRALVVAAETPSHYFDLDHPSQALVYGDGAAALVLERAAPGRAGEEGAAPGLLGAELGRASLPGQVLTVPGALPPHADELALGRFRFTPPDAEYGAALEECWRAVARRLSALGAELGSPPHAWVPYAVTRAQLQAVREAGEVPDGALHDDLRAHGCLGAAALPAALHRARTRGAVGDGDVLALCAVAGGVSFGAALWRLGGAL